MTCPDLPVNDPVMPPAKPTDVIAGPGFISDWSSCPVVPPKVEHMRFYPSAPIWSRAMRLIADGVMDTEGVPGLARRLGYSVRQIERQLTAELGAGPLAIARAQRAQTARILIETSALP